MATLQATKSHGISGANSITTQTIDPSLKVAYGFYLYNATTTPLAADDQIEMCEVPGYSIIIDGRLRCSDLDDDATEAVEIDVGLQEFGGTFQSNVLLNSGVLTGDTSVHLPGDSILMPFTMASGSRVVTRNAKIIATVEAEPATADANPVQFIEVIVYYVTR